MNDRWRKDSLTPIEVFSLTVAMIGDAPSFDCECNVFHVISELFSMEEVQSGYLAFAF